MKRRGLVGVSAWIVIRLYTNERSLYLPSRRCHMNQTLIRSKTFFFPLSWSQPPPHPPPADSQRLQPTPTWVECTLTYTHKWMGSLPLLPTPCRYTQQYALYSETSANGVFISRRGTRTGPGNTLFIPLLGPPIKPICPSESYSCRVHRSFEIFYE